MAELRKSLKYQCAVNIFTYLYAHIESVHKNLRGNIRNSTKKKKVFSLGFGGIVSVLIKTECD